MDPLFTDDGRLRAFWRFVLGAVLAIVANYIAIGVAASVSHGRERLLDAVYRPLTMVLLLAGFALLLLTADRLEEGVMRALGLGRFPGWQRQAWLGIAIGAGLICLAVAWIALSGDLREVRLNLNGHTLALVLVELLILSTGAMAEELMFRGYPFQRLLDATGPLVAVPAMSLLFGVAHGANPHASKLAMLNTFAIGGLLAVAYLRTRALWLPWGIHFAWNTTLGLAFGLPVSGLTDFAVIVRARAAGPRWVTGGGYGIEGSVVGTIVVLLGFLPVILLTRQPAEPKLEVEAMVHTGIPEQPSTPDQSGAGRIQL